MLTSPDWLTLPIDRTPQIDGYKSFVDFLINLNLLINDIFDNFSQSKQISNINLWPVHFLKISEVPPPRKMKLENGKLLKGKNFHLS